MRAPRVGPWGPKVRGGGAALGAPGVAVEPVSCGVMDSVPPSVGGRGQAGVRPHSLWWARQASGMCDGEGTAMCPVAYVCDTRATRRHRRGVSAYTARAPETGVHDIRGTTRRRFRRQRMKMRIVLEGLALTEGTSRGVLVRSLA